MAQDPETLRPLLARRRLEAARQMLERCHLCLHRCGVNRWAGERGPCHAGPRSRIFHAQLEVGDEKVLVPAFAISLSGCDMRCAFCITGRESWDPKAGALWSAEAVARQAERALENGARTVMILGGEPTIHLPSVLELVAAMPEEAPLVWKTNAHGTAEARELLEGLFDVWLADYKFGNDHCAERLARVRGYTEGVRENLIWANRRTGLIVRHLLMPGHVECCWRPVADWLAAELPGVAVSLQTAYWPAWQSRRHAELGRVVAPKEAERALAVAHERDLLLIP